MVLRLSKSFRIVSSADLSGLSEVGVQDLVCCWMRLQRIGSRVP